MTPVRGGVASLALAAQLLGEASSLSEASHKERGANIAEDLARAHADMLHHQLHAQRPLHGDALPGGISARRAQDTGGGCLSGDFRVTSDARPEVAGCYFDTGTTNYDLPQYTENGQFESGQFWVFPYYDSFRDGVYWGIILHPCSFCSSQGYCTSWQEASEYHPADVENWSCLDDLDSNIFDLTTPTELSVVCGCSETSSSTSGIPQPTPPQTPVTTPAPRGTPSPSTPPTVPPTSTTPQSTAVPQTSAPVTAPEPTPSPSIPLTAEPTAVTQPPTPSPLLPIVSATTAPATAPTPTATASPLAASRAPAAATAAAPTVAPTPGTRGGINVSSDAPSTTEEVVGGGTSDATIGRSRAGSFVALVVATMAGAGAVAAFGALAM